MLIINWKKICNTFWCSKNSINFYHLKATPRFLGDGLESPSKKGLDTARTLPQLPPKVPPSTPKNFLVKKIPRCFTITYPMMRPITINQRRGEAPSRIHISPTERDLKCLFCLNLILIHNKTYTSQGKNGDS